ncbi:MAG: TetR/AcrR family transcriptional regulator [Acidimicrobiales bacterium]
MPQVSRMAVAHRSGERVSREDVVEAAVRIVERDGAGALTMRRLADDLGVAVTSIYWHVGNRDALVDLLVDRLLAEMGDVHPAGPDPRRRVAGLASELRDRLLARPHLIALADQRARTAAMFQPAQAAIAAELAALGVRGRRAAEVIQVLQCHVVASVVLARAVDRSPTQAGTDPAQWGGHPGDPRLVEALAKAPDLDRAFVQGLEALVDRLLPPAEAEPGTGRARPATAGRSRTGRRPRGR